MPRSINKEQILKCAVAMILFAMFAFQAMALRGIFADGSYQLLNLLLFEQNPSANGSLFAELVTRNNEPSRFFAYILMEFPTVIALRLGMTDLKGLMYLFSSWLQLAPLLLWGLAFWKLRRDFLFWPFLAMFTAVYFNGNFFSIGEFNVTFGLTAACLAYILKPERITKVDTAMLSAAAIASVMSYGSTMFFGVLLCGLTLWRFRQDRRILWLPLAAIFLASAGVGLWNYLNPTQPENLASASNPLLLLHDPQLWFTFVFVALIAPIAMVRDAQWRSAFILALFISIIGFLLMGLHAPPFVDYMARAFTAMGFLALAIALCWFELFGKKRFPALKKLETNPWQYFALPTFALFTLMCVLDIGDSIEFRAYIDDFSRVVNSHHGLLRYEDSIMFLPNNNLYGWTWTYPTMALLLRENTDKAVVIEPWFQKGRWQPFDPRTYVPDLSPYY
ncbi:MAG TPA: hypothetical protein VFR09_03235 [Alphaproteobacteria bacterium]|nr:hypothetical protein [Alphaproteobacteria bacterium]